jgi:hypothetical protein
MIKTILKEKFDKTDFPKLMKYNRKDSNFVVLFSSDKVGMVVESQDDERPVGYYLNNWYMSSFSDFRGSVTLENGL